MRSVVLRFHLLVGKELRVPRGISNIHPNIKNAKNPAEGIFLWVGLSRFELETSSLSVTRSNQLSYKPAQFLMARGPDRT